MKCSLGICNFLEKISSISYSVLFLYFFALIDNEGFLSLLAILWNSAFRCLCLFFSPLLFASLLVSMVAQRLKRLPPMQETQVRSLGQGDPLEKEMVTHSSILAWRIPWTEDPGGLQTMGSQRVGHD